MFTWITGLSIASILLVILLGTAEKQGKLRANTSSVVMMLLGISWSIIGFFTPVQTEQVQSTAVTVYLSGLGLSMIAVGAWSFFRNIIRSRV